MRNPEMSGQTKQNNIGAAIPRLEDSRLIVGQGRFSDDRHVKNALHMVVLRSPHAHAKIVSIDTSRAAAATDIKLVLTGKNWIEDGLDPMPAWGNPKDVELKNRDGKEIFYTPLYPLAIEKVRRVGEPVALVAADSELAALHALDLIEVTYDVLPAIVDLRSAADPGAPRVWDEVDANISVDDEKGDRLATNEIFARAPNIVSLETWNNRVTGVPMEPRAALVEIEPSTGHLTLYTGGQGVNRFQNELTKTFGLEKSQLRVVSDDVGGGYGTRNHTYVEFALVIWVAKRLDKPVRWRATRTECFLSDYAGRDLLTHAELAMDEKGRILAMRSYNIGNLGTHTISFVPFARGPSVFNGVYDIPIAHVTTKLVFTNQTPTASYRGAGRPESMFVIERLMDLAAIKTGLDRAEVRRRNLIPPSAMPYSNPLAVTYDSGLFEKSMDMALELVSWNTFQQRRRAARKKGRYIGIGIANYIETATGYPQERCEMSVHADGHVELIIGTQSSGQSHETTYAQIVSDWLGVPIECIRLRTGDTDFVLMGSGSHSSRSLRLAGHLYKQTSDTIIARGKSIAAHKLEAAEADIEFSDGQFTIVGTNRSLSLFDIASIAENSTTPETLRGRLHAIAEVIEQVPAYPNGCHACEVEVDVDTGLVSILRYVGVDDVGRVINPMIVDGQTHGGAAQGIGQALMEECIYDPENGQLLNASFMDYAMPRATDIPEFVLEFNEVIAETTYLGVKGGGEGGATAAPPALINAIVDALSDFGIDHLEMPATSERIWRTVQKKIAERA